MRAVLVAVLGLLAAAAPARADLQACCAAPALLPDIRATGLEVTQGVQAALPAKGRYTGVRLVSHRTTVVRLYANVPAGQAKLVAATLTGTHGGHALPGSPLSSDEDLKALAPGRAAQRGDSGQGFTFTLPDSWTVGTIRLRGTVAGIGVVYGAGGECATAACAANNTIDLRDVKFRATGSERVEPVRLTSRSWPAVPKPKAALAYPKLLEPLADGAFQFDPERYASEMDITRIGDASTLGGLLAHCPTLLGSACAMALDKTTKAALVASQLADAMLVDQTCKAIGTPPPCPDQVAGVDNAPTAAPPVLGQISRGALGRSALPTAVIDAGVPQGAAHELGHGLGRAHAGSACGASAQKSPFDPWPPDQRGDLNSIGLDIRPGSGAAYGGEYRAIAPRGQGSADIAAADFNPGEWYDYMSYCSQHRDGRDLSKLDSWISAKGWDDEYAALRAYGRAHARLAAVRPVAGLHVTGFSVGGGPLVVWGLRPAVAVVPPDDKAGYSAIVRSRAGKTLGSAVLRAETTHVDDFAGGAPASVTIVDGIVPLKGATATTLPGGAADLVVSHAGSRAALRTRSLHAPRVKLTRQRFKLKRGAALKVAWKAADADKDSLMASVDYSPDGGRSFRTVWSGPNTGAATIPGGSLTGSTNAFIRVRVSDGFDQANALSRPFTAPGRAPDVAIARPAAGETIPASVPLRLSGEAYDDRSAALGPGSLAWTLDGKPVPADAPKPGRHTLRLTATDASGRRGHATVRFTVAAVTPHALSVAAPAKLAKDAKSVTLTVAAATACRLGIAGAGVSRRTVAVSRAPTQVTVAVKPGSAALRLQLTFRSGKSGTRETLVIARG